MHHLVDGRTPTGRPIHRASSQAIPGYRKLEIFHFINFTKVSSRRMNSHDQAR